VLDDHSIACRRSKNTARLLRRHQRDRPISADYPRPAS
jgi:hypothetical protein